VVNFTVLDLFSGIGGFSLGLERAGMETVAFCENDKFCQKVLAKHWPDIPIHENIEELDGRQYRGTVDLVCGGFPCQPFSVAGEQRGKEDDRALWPEMLRVIREVEPAWVIGENVSGIINMELDNVLSDLEDSGYSCQTFVIPACSVDAKHRRDRVWIIASHANFNSKPDGSQHERQGAGQLDVADSIDNDGRGRSGSQPRGRHSRVEHRGGGSGQPERETDSPVGNTDNLGSLLSSHETERGGSASRHSEGKLERGSSDVVNAKHDGSFATEITRSSSSSSDNDTKGQESPSKFEGASRPGNGEAVAYASIERLQGSEETGNSLGSRTNREQFSARFGGVSGRDNPSAQPGMGGMADGVSRWLDEPEGIPRVIGKVPDRVNRLKALGNAVVPQVVEVLGRFIIDKE